MNCEKRDVFGLIFRNFKWWHILTKLLKIKFTKVHFINHVEVITEFQSQQLVYKFEMRNLFVMSVFKDFEMLVPVMTSYCQNWVKKGPDSKISRPNTYKKIKISNSMNLHAHSLVNTFSKVLNFGTFYYVTIPNWVNYFRK